MSRVNLDAPAHVLCDQALAVRNGEIQQLRADNERLREQLREHHRLAHELIDEIGVAIAGVEVEAEDGGENEAAGGARECMRAVAKLRASWVEKTNAMMGSPSEGKDQ